MTVTDVIHFPVISTKCRVFLGRLTWEMLTNHRHWFIT